MAEMLPKIRPWFTMWKGRNILPNSRDDKNDSGRCEEEDREALIKTEDDKGESTPKPSEKVKRQSTFRRKFSLRRKKSIKETSVSSTTSNTTSSDGDLSDDSDSLEKYEDEITLVNSINLSSQTLSIAGANENFSERDGPAERLTQMFIEDINNAVERTLALPDGPEKASFIHHVLESMKPIRNYTTLNLHFVILSSLLSDEVEQKSSTSSNKDTSKV